MIPRLLLSIATAAAFGGQLARADEPSGTQYLRDAQQLYESGQYFKSARYAFAAMEADPKLKPRAYAWVSLGLVRAGLPNAASYFFIRTLEMGDNAAIRPVLGVTQTILTYVGGDLIRKYLIRHTRYDDYDAYNRAAYLYSLGKDAILSGDTSKAVGYLSGIQSNHPLRPFALQLRGSAHAILGNNDAALRDFRDCASDASDIVSAAGADSYRKALARRESEDLKARCQAGEARTLYQMEKFHEADRAYDQIQKTSYVWPDILFEQAWNSFAKREYNRSLGKLVSYKSPALNFVFNTEIDVLRAQSFLALCLFSDANDVINEFNGKYTRVGEQVKQFVERNSQNLPLFYQAGKDALKDSIYTSNQFHRMMNGFVRGPYFQNLVASERQISREEEAVRKFDSMQSGVEHDLAQGFPGFLSQVLRWRTETAKLMGGAYVKNSLLDYHSALISDFEKIAFIKLEMLKQAKDRLVFKNAPPSGDRSRGDVEPSRRDDQYYWSFNGEFWNDELGDYVFGLESQCGS